MKQLLIYWGVVVLALLVLCFVNLYFARMIIGIILAALKVFKKELRRKKKYLWCIALCIVFGLEAFGFYRFNKYI